MLNFFRKKIPAEYKKLYHLFSRKERLKFGILFGMMLVAAVLEVAGIGMIPAFVGIVADPEMVMRYGPVKNVLDTLGITTAHELLKWGAVALIGIFIVKNAYLVGYFYIESRFINNRMYHIAHRLMQSYMQAQYTFHLQRNTAELLRNIINETKLLMEQVVLPGLKVAREGIMIISIMAFLLVIEPFITLVVFLLLGSAIGLFLLLTQKRVKKYGKEEQGFRRNMIKAVDQGLGGIKDARILNREADFVEQFRFSAFKQARYRTFQKFVSQISKPVVETIAVVGMMLIAVIMVLQGRPMSAIIPILSLFAMATVRLMPAINQVANNYTKLHYNFVSVHPIYDDLQGLREYRA
ncbi:MAG TPA: ABC transporter transmembrane domain-containing protein, partial [Balneolaceae bacterium]|nr:ABC transporter transmembrane domain-containing protein [Balneolaceae bacterium]